MENQEEILKELEMLEGKASTISELVKKAKSRVLNNEQISPEELDMVVENIAKLDVMMRERTDVGH
jgi:3-oxoacyl-[acyl-carrier-protein] synthase III